MSDTTKMAIDRSTINMHQLGMLPLYKKPPTYHIDPRMGNGCAGDPPGYPTYFTQCVYTQYGNSPHRGATLLLFGRVVDSIGGTYEHLQARLRRLWNPLPLEHPRTQAWIRSTFAYHRHCYHVPGKEDLSWHDDQRFLVWPGGTLGKTPFGTIKDLEHEIKWAKEHEFYDKWTEESKLQFENAIVINNERIKKQCEAMAVPENATATILVRRYYPEFVPTPDLFAEDLERPSNWWERLPECPTPDRCPGEPWQKHPVNHSWCQVCGWHAEEKKEEGNAEKHN